METWLLGLILFSALLLLLFLGMPVAFSLGGVATVACLFIWGPRGLYSIVTASYGEVTQFVFLAVPLYILMAEVLSFSGIVEEMFDIVYTWSGSIRGGLAAGTMVVSAVFAAMVGVSTASAATMGVVALPPILKRGYDKRLATGTIAAGGALGILIPPSIIMIILGSVAHLSIGQLFAGGIIPGILLTILFIIYILVRAWLSPQYAPALPPDELVAWSEKLRLLWKVIPAILLISLVLGSIYLGIATPTESAALGALGSFILAASKRRLHLANLNHVLQHTLSLTSMILWITIGAINFTIIVEITGVSNWLHEAVLGLELNRWVILWGTQLLFFVLGCILDPVGIIMITIPILMPLIIDLGFDPLWFGILFIVNMETAYITPPFGFNLFVLRSVVPPSVSIKDIYRGVVPFVLCQALALALIVYFPDMATWLPKILIK